MDGARHALLQDLAPEPMVLRTVGMKEVRATGVLDLRQMGYRRALAQVNNRTGSGRLQRHAAELLGCDSGDVILFGRDGFTPMYHRVPHEAPVRIGEVDAVRFTTRRGMPRLRRIVPPTLPHTLSVNATKFTDEDDFPDFAARNRKRMLERARRKIPLAADSTSAALLPSGPGLENLMLKEYMRAGVRESRNLPPDVDIALYLGGTHAEEVVFGLLSRSGRLRPKTGMQCHEFDLATQAALALNHDVRRINIHYGDIGKTEIPHDIQNIFISIPNNPTGLSLNLDEISTFLDGLEQSAHLGGEESVERTVIFDLVGYDTTNDKQDFVAELIAMAQRKGVHIIIVDSASKSEAFAEDRIGWVWSNRPDFNALLKTHEIPYISPLTIRAWRKRKRHMAQTNKLGLNFYEQSASYLESFHAVLRNIVALSGGKVSIYTPKVAKRDPRGYYVTLKFEDAGLARRYQHELQLRGKEEEYLDKEGAGLKPRHVALPLAGTRHGQQRKPKPGQRIKFDSKNRGMPYLDGKYVRLCAAGPAFQLEALAEVLGID